MTNYNITISINDSENDGGAITRYGNTEAVGNFAADIVSCIENISDYTPWRALEIIANMVHKYGEGSVLSNHEKELVESARRFLSREDLNRKPSTQASIIKSEKDEKIT